MGWWPRQAVLWDNREYQTVRAAKEPPHKFRFPVPQAWALSGVAVNPGPMALTRIPIGPSSIAKALVNSRTPPFEVV